MQKNGYMSRKNKLMEDILQYLQKNPDAGDTLEGVAQWWLLRIQVETALDEVASALLQLEKDGVLEGRVSGNGSKIYKVRKKIFPSDPDK